MSKRRRTSPATDRTPASAPAARPPAGRDPDRVADRAAPAAVAGAAVPPPDEGGGLRTHRAAWIATLVVGVAALVLYLRTLSPSVATGDSGELTTMAAILGIPHPPGYPLFTILGHVFTWLPFGDAAYRVNLMSAVLDAVTVVAVVLLGGRLIESARDVPRGPAGRVAGSGRASRRPSPAVDAEPDARTDRAARLGPWLAAGAGGAALAVSTAFWRYSLAAEVFPLNNLLAVLVLLLMLEWSRRPERMRVLWAAGLTAGLALANQQTIVFVAPGLLALLVIGVRRYVQPPAGKRAGRSIPWRSLGIAVGLGVAGLVPYLYLPLAAAGGAPSAWGDPTTLGGFLGIVGRTAYGTLSFTVRDTSGSPIEHLGLFAGYVVSAFTPVGIALAALGFGWLALRRTGEAVALGLWFLVAGPVFLVIANPPLSDPVTRGVLERFYILPSLAIPVAIAAGAWVLGRWLTARVPMGAGRLTARRWLGVVPAVAVLAGLIGLAAIRLPDVDLSRDRVAEAYADDLLGGLPPNALLIMRSDENYTSMAYAQSVRHLRPDVVAVDAELLKLPSYVKRIQADHPDIHIPFAAYDGGVRTSLVSLVGVVLTGRPVFVAGDLEEDLSKSFDVLDRGLTEQILAKGQAPDRLATLRADPGLFDRLHFPDRTYPDTTWEAAIAAHYADVAFQTGVALQSLGPQKDAAEVEHLYRAAIRLSPTLSAAYKNLGILLQTNGGQPSQIIPLWEEYLALVPDDPEAGAIRDAITRLRGEGSPTPSP